MLRVVAIVAIIVGLKVLAGHLPIGAQVADISWPWDRVRTQSTASYPMPDNGVLQVSNTSGDIYVTGGSGSTVEVTVKKSATNHNDLDAMSSHVATVADGGSANAGITITTDYPHHCSNCDLSYEITVPRGVKVIADVDSGDVHVSGTSGLIDVTSSSGDVRLTNDSGAMNVDASSGDVRLTNISGAARVQSSSGDIDATGLSKDVDLDASSGDVIAKYVSFDNVSTVRLRTASGSITLDVPRSFGGRITASTDSGDLSSNMKLPIHDHDSGSDVSVAVGSAKTIIDIAASSGDITIDAR
ncbi:MAG TPA: DUF4097 family beta strand repeat-containing protein [Candidatus Eremiobacteraceae bacterium]